MCYETITLSSFPLSTLQERTQKFTISSKIHAMDLEEKLKKIEALFDGAKTEGVYRNLKSRLTAT